MNYDNKYSENPNINFLINNLQRRADEIRLLRINRLREFFNLPLLKDLDGTLENDLDSEEPDNGTDVSS